MYKRFSVLIIFMIFVLSVFFAIILLRIDFSKSTFSAGDITLMLPPIAWLYLACLMAVFVLIDLIFHGNFNWAIIFNSGVILTIIYPVIQYPCIFFRDSFLHGTLSEYVVSYGSLPQTATYSQYPGSFILSSILCEVLGNSTIQTNIALAAFINFLIIYMLLVLGKVLFGEKECWVSPAIYFAFSFRHYTGLLWYSPMLLGFLLYIFVIYILVKSLRSKPEENRLYIIILSFLGIAITMCHPFSSAFTLAICVCIFTFKGIVKISLKKKLIITSTFTCFVISIFVSWHFFIAQQTLYDVATYLSKVIRGETTIRPIEAVWTPTKAFTYLTVLYRYGIYGLFGALSVFGLIAYRQKAEIKLIFAMLLGVFLGGFLINLTPAVYGVGRALIYGGVIVATLAGYSIVIKSERQLIGATKEIIKKVVQILVILTFLISCLNISVYAWFIHSDEVSGAMFVNRKIKGTIAAVLDEAFIINYLSLNNTSQVIYISDRSAPDVAKNKFKNGDFILEYLPRLVYYYNVTSINGVNNLIYSNGFTRIYSKVIIYP